MKPLKRIVIPGILSACLFLASLVVIAFARTKGKTEIEFLFHINKKLVMESVYGESPTFAIWMEDPVSGEARTIFVTSRAGLGDWERKAEVPEALPLWEEVRKEEMQRQDHGTRSALSTDAISGATPKPGYFIERVGVPPGSRWLCLIEMNLSGDYNEVYKEYDEQTHTEDLYKTGQPALLFSAELEAREGTEVRPDVVGMSVLDPETGEASLQPLNGITTALEVFDEMRISVVRPKPRIIRKKQRTVLNQRPM